MYPDHQKLLPDTDQGRTGNIFRHGHFGLDPIALGNVESRESIRKFGDAVKEAITPSTGVGAEFCIRQRITGSGPGTGNGIINIGKQSVSTTATEAGTIFSGNDDNIGSCRMIDGNTDFMDKTDARHAGKANSGARNIDRINDGKSPAFRNLITDACETAGSCKN